MNRVTMRVGMFPSRLQHWRAARTFIERFCREAGVPREACLKANLVAEELFLRQMTSGASNDIERATELARKMVCELGMSPLGPLHYRRPSSAWDNDGRASGGSVTGTAWSNHSFPGSTSFVVELPAGPIPRAVLTRHLRAIRAVELGRRSGSAGRCDSFTTAA